MVSLRNLLSFRHKVGAPARLCRRERLPKRVGHRALPRAVEVIRRADLCRSHWSGRLRSAGSRVLTARREAGFPLQ